MLKYYNLELLRRRPNSRYSETSNGLERRVVRETGDVWDLHTLSGAWKTQAFRQRLQYKGHWRGRVKNGSSFHGRTIRSINQNTSRPEQRFGRMSSGSIWHDKLRSTSGQWKLMHYPCVPSVTRYDVASGISCIDAETCTSLQNALVGDNSGKSGVTSMWRLFHREVVTWIADMHIEGVCETYK